MLFSLTAVGYAMVSAMRPLPATFQTKPLSPGSVSVEWNSRGVIWRRWKALQPLPESPVERTGALSAAVVPRNTADVFVFRTGEVSHVNFMGAAAFPYRYYHIPADGVGQAGAVGILVSALLVAMAQRARNRG